ncbi:translation initiation factor IF-2 [Streptomyces sp. NPDC127108]|uniref:translation initiation factor IF-2 n=1 Tax=Streptomyces sp. NPDC127108 TaxID=3345361 RepID=UPI00363CB4DC
MENWRENGSSRPTEGHFGPDGGLPEWSGGLPAPTHDPNEVTVQIDGVGRCLAGEYGGSAAGGTRVMQGFSDTRSVADTPVFVDETGRRSRRYRRIGAVVGLLCAGYAVVMAGTLVSGNSSAPWLPVPDPKDEQPASQVDTPELPTESAAGPTAPASGGAGPKSPSASASGSASGSGSVSAGTSMDSRAGEDGAPGAGGGSGRSIPGSRGGDAARGSEGSSGARPAPESGGEAGLHPTGGGGTDGSTAPGDDATPPGPDPDPGPAEETGPPAASPTRTPDGASGGAEGEGGAGADAGGDAGAEARAVSDGRVQEDEAAGGVRA